MEKNSILGTLFSTPLFRGKSYNDEKPVIDFELTGSKYEKNRLSYLVNTIANSSDIGRDILKDAAKLGVKLSFDVQPECLGSFGSGEEDGKGPHISLNPTMSDNDLIATLTHEARHAQQYLRGNTQKFGECTPKTEVMLYRAAEADAQTAALTTVLDIREKTGNSAPFDTFKERSPHIVKKLPEDIISGKAPFKPSAVLMQQMFDGWYDSSVMLFSYETSYIRNPMLYTMSHKEFDKMPYDKEMSSAEIVNMFCKTPDGSCYWKNRPNVLEDTPKTIIDVTTLNVIDEYAKTMKRKTGKEMNPSYKSLAIDCYGRIYESVNEYRESKKQLNAKKQLNPIFALKAAKTR